MSADAKDDIELMQHLDGELDERAEAVVRGRIERDAGVRTKAEMLGEMGELVRGHLELASEAVPDRRFEGMWRTIAREIKTEAPAEEARPQPSRGVWAKISSWFDRYRGHVITGAVSAGAVAALALVLRPAPHDDAGVATNNPNAPIDVRPVALREAPVIEALETPDGSAQVLNIEDEDGHTAVIWVTPKDTVEGI